MAYVYFPGCKYTALSPETSSKIKKYLNEKRNMMVTGCCRVNHNKLTKQDIALAVCPTCLFNLQQSAPQVKSQSLWEILADDDDFPWPDFGGHAITVQDCMDTSNNLEWQSAVRSILKRMNVTVVEIEESFEKADFCNIEASKSPESKEKKMEQLMNHCKQYTTDTVVCYCTGCYNSLKIAGMHSVHLIDMIMNGF